MQRYTTRRVVEDILLEFDDGGWWDDDYGDYGGYGGGSNGKTGLYSTFIQPFTDVLATAAATVETGMSRMQMLTTLASYAILDVLFPYLRPKYDEIFRFFDRRVDKIRKKYSNVFKRTERALTEVGGDYDGAPLFFVLFPDAVIGRNLAKFAAKGAERPLKTFADSALDVFDALTFNRFEQLTSDIRKHLNLQECIVSDVNLLLVEADDEHDDDSNDNDDDDKARKAITLVAKFLTSQKARRAIHNSDVVKSMRRDALLSLKEMLEQIVKQIKQLKGVDSLSKLEALVGTKLNIEGVAKKLGIDIDDASINRRELDAAIKDVLPELVHRAMEPFMQRLKSLHDGFVAFADAYDVKDDPTYKIVVKLFRQAEEALHG